MPYIGIDSLDSKGVAFIVNIPNMLTRICNINIPPIAIGTVILSLRTVVNNLLDTFR